MSNICTNKVLTRTIVRDMINTERGYIMNFLKKHTILLFVIAVFTVVYIGTISESNYQESSDLIADSESENQDI